MPKNNNIRWRDSDEKKLKNSIRNFNAKIDRQVKKGVNINALPEKLNYKTIREETTNRKDFNKTLKQTEKFRQRGQEKIITSEFGIEKTKFEIETIKRDVQRINRERKKKASAAQQKNFTVAGNVIDKQEINTKTKIFNFEKIHSYSDFAKFAKSVKKQSAYKYDDESKATFFSNIIKGIESGLGDGSKELIKRIQKIGQEKLIAHLENEKLVNIDFFYSPVSIDERISAIEEFLVNM